MIEHATGNTDQTDHLADAVVGAWHRLAADMHTLRRVLDAHETASPALVHALSGEYRMLATAAGLATLNTPAGQTIEAGRALRQQIRISGTTAASLAPSGARVLELAQAS